MGRSAAGLCKWTQAPRAPLSVRSRAPRREDLGGAADRCKCPPRRATTGLAARCSSPSKCEADRYVRTLRGGELAVSAAHEAFDDKGLLKDEKQVRMLANVVESFVQTTKSLKK